MGSARRRGRALPRRYRGRADRAVGHPRRRFTTTAAAPPRPASTAPSCSPRSAPTTPSATRRWREIVSHRTPPFPRLRLCPPPSATGAASRSWSTGPWALRLPRDQGTPPRRPADPRGLRRVARRCRLPVLYDPMGTSLPLELVARSTRGWRSSSRTSAASPTTGGRSAPSSTCWPGTPTCTPTPPACAASTYLVEAVGRAGPGKVLFGSDGPWLHPGVELAKVHARWACPRRRQSHGARRQPAAAAGQARAAGDSGVDARGGWRGAAGADAGPPRGVQRAGATGDGRTGMSGSGGPPRVRRRTPATVGAVRSASWVR